MVKEAEANAAEDKKRREGVEAKNQAESLIHSTEKAMKDYGDKLGPADKEAVEASMSALRDALAKDDAEAIKARTNDLMQASMKIGEAMYKAEQDKAEGDAARHAAADAAASGGAKPKDDVIDADFKEVKDDKKKSA
jgi:molecular chaperone DnaK